MARYPGGKNGNGTFQQIINKIPPHDFYFEGFAGSGAIYRLKKAAVTSILCDKVPAIIANFRVTAEAGIIAINYDTVRNIEFIVNFLNFLSDNSRIVFAYFDPPYEFSTRTCKKNMYQYELFTADHIALLKGLQKARFKCMISCY